MLQFQYRSVQNQLSNQMSTCRSAQGHHLVLAGKLQFASPSTSIEIGDKNKGIDLRVLDSSTYTFAAYFRTASSYVVNSFFLKSLPLVGLLTYSSLSFTRL